MLNNMAYQKPLISNPCTKCALMSRIQALITNRNKPSVKMVAGKVSRISKGFTNASSNASTMATTMAVKKLLFTISTPGNR